MGAESSALCKPLLAFWKLPLPHYSRQRIELAIHLFWHFIACHGGKPDAHVFRSQSADCLPQYFKWPDFLLHYLPYCGKGCVIPRHVHRLTIGDSTPTKRFYLRLDTRINDALLTPEGLPRLVVCPTRSTLTFFIFWVPWCQDASWQCYGESNPDPRRDNPI